MRIFICVFAEVENVLLVRHDLVVGANLESIVVCVCVVSGGYVCLLYTVQVPGEAGICHLALRMSCSLNAGIDEHEGKPSPHCGEIDPVKASPGFMILTL